MKPYIVFVTLAALAPLVHAQTRSTLPHPGDPAAKVPAVKYESALTGYSPFREEKLAPWREVNDEVARIGGQSGIFGGAGHGAHGQSKPATTSPVPNPKPAQAAPGNDHQH